MRLTSTYTSSTTTDIPVLIVCYGTRRVLMLKAHTYKEMMINIRQKFDIDERRGVILETTALDVCRGCKVEIDEDVWPVMRSSLDEVTVVARDSAVELDVPLPSGLCVPESRALADSEQPTAGNMKEESLEEWVNETSQVPQEMDGDQALNPLRTPRAPARFEEDAGTEGALVRGDENDREDYEGYEDDDHREDEEEKVVTPVKPAKPLRNWPRALMDAIKPPPAHNGQPPEEEANQAKDQSLEERFQVRITAHTDQNAEIKTRGKHLVKKVLAAVCKTFGLDYDSAALYLVTCDEGEDGEIRERYVRCPPDWSMARCGITSGSELRVVQVEELEIAVAPVAQRSK